MSAGNCESCTNYRFDEDWGCYVCLVNLDEDEYDRFVRGTFGDCPYYSLADEYKIVEKQK
ncbi:MAG: DUF6472 family protein [Oscillospiraceae bacterium]|nr:DUF6472 family protein [Oscillospiraceae bacterium]